MLQGEHSAIPLTFIKLPFVIKIFVLSIIEWPLKTVFTVNTMFKKAHDLNMDFRSFINSFKQLCAKVYMQE